MRAPITLSCAVVLSLTGLLVGASPHEAAAAAQGQTAASARKSCSQTTVTVNGSNPGPTPFIAFLDVTISPPSALKTVRFTVEPKPVSVTRPVSASYSSAYLEGRGYLDPATGDLTLPIFGLYQNFSNQVRLSFGLDPCPSQEAIALVPTAAWVDPIGGAYTSPVVVQPRSSATDLSYDFIMLKGYAAPISPVIIDTDGEVRWVGTATLASIPSIFFDNGIYVSSGSGLVRLELDGAFATLANYSSRGVTSTGHHNYDPGKKGILVEVYEVDSIESTILEVDRTGAVLKTWRLADIIRAAMIAGGDDPSAFVRAADDWFHNNSATYNRNDNTLVVSSRENFVIALDYNTGKIKWILGDPTKAWYQYPSLRKYALTLVGDTHPPIGQHALSITTNGELLLFDDGRASLNQIPAGEDRTYSAPRRYTINPKKMTAQETWNYLASPSLYSPFCSSVYEDDQDNYLMDYTLTGDVMGFNASGEKVFHYVYSTAYFCELSWNAIPIHLENVTFP